MLEKINLDEIKSIALKTGKAVMEIYNKNFKVSYKDTLILELAYAPTIIVPKRILPLKLNHQTYKMVASKSHMSEETKKFIDNLQTPLKKELITMGSSLKICLVANDEAKCYPHLSPTMEWNTAAADTIARESGKITYEYQNKKVLLYNKENLRNPYFIVE